MRPLTRMRSGRELPTNRTKYCPCASRSSCTELVVLPGWKQLKPGTSVKFVLLAPVVLTTTVALMPPALQKRWKAEAGEPSSFVAFAALATFRPDACFEISWSAIVRTFLLSFPLSAA